MNPLNFAGKLAVSLQTTQASASILLILPLLAALFWLWSMLRQICSVSAAHDPDLPAFGSAFASATRHVDSRPKPPQEARETTANLPVSQSLLFECVFGGLSSQMARELATVWPSVLVDAAQAGAVQGMLVLPLLLTVDQVRYWAPRDQVQAALKLLKIWMNWTDAQVLTDLKQAMSGAINAAMFEVASGGAALRDEQLVEELANRQRAHFSAEMVRRIRQFSDNSKNFRNPAADEKSVSLPEEISRRYPRLPVYVRWLLSQHPELEADAGIRQQIADLDTRMRTIPRYDAELVNHGRNAFLKVMGLNRGVADRIARWQNKKDVRERSTHATPLLTVWRVLQSLGWFISPARRSALPPAGEDFTPDRRELVQMNVTLRRTTTMVATEIETKSRDLKDRRSELEEVNTALMETAEDHETTREVLREYAAYLNREIIRIGVDLANLELQQREGTSWLSRLEDATS